MSIKFYQSLRDWVVGRGAATAIEYGLIAGGIALAIIMAVYLAGDSLAGIFSLMAGTMSDSAGNVSAI